MKKLLAWWLLSVSIAAFADVNTEPVDETRVSDSAVPLPGLRNSLGLTLEVPKLQFSLYKKGDQNKSQFNPNVTANAGIEGSYEGYKGGFSAPLPQTGDSLRQKGNTSHLDFNFGHYWDQIGADVYYQTYNGFYLDKGESSKEGTIYAQRGDVSSQFFGANMYYAFSPERYPLASLTHFENSQAGSGGSVVAYLSLNEFNIHGSTPLVPDTGLTSARLRTSTVGGGYAYRWQRDHHTLSGFILLGGGPQMQNLAFTSGAQYHTSLSEQVVLNGSYAYEFDQWQSGIVLKVNTITSDIGNDEKLDATSEAVKIFATRTF